jgi:hypothetical protein
VVVTEPRRRLADRLLDSGLALASEFAEQDRLDPTRPPLSVLVAENAAHHERIGEDRILARVREVIEQRTALRDQRAARARKLIDEGNLPPAASELSWAAALDEQLGALRAVLATVETDRIRAGS